MPGALRVFPDDRPENVIRKSVWRWWVISMSGIVWLLYFGLEPNPMSFWIPIIVTIGSIPAGWLFGYKLGVVPIFAGVYMFKPKEKVKGDPS